MNDDKHMRDRDDQQEDQAENEMAWILDDPVHALRAVKRGDVVEGTVVAIDRDEILVDIGLKSEAVLPIRELFSTGYGSLDEISLNSSVLVYVTQPETPEGHAVVSIKKARQERQWRIAQEQHERGEILEAKVIESNKGGLIVDLEGLRGFVPISQIRDLKREDTADNAETQAKLQGMVSRMLKLKIIEINRNRNRLILSERLAMQEWRTKRRDELLSELQIGEVRHGVVSNLAHFGAFIDLGGADGLVHISQLAWTRVNHPSEVLRVGQEVEVQVLSVDRERKKIALSIKRAEIDPWTTVEQRYQIGQVVTGTVTKITPFGAFARIENGVEGLIHVSEVYPPTNDAKTILKENQEVQVRILRIESDRRRLGLSMRQVDAPDASPISNGTVDDHVYDLAEDAREPVAAAAPQVATPAPKAAAPTPVAAPTGMNVNENTAPTTSLGAALSAALSRQAEKGGHQDGDGSTPA